MNRPDGEVVTLRTANPPCGGSIPPQASTEHIALFSMAMCSVRSRVGIEQAQARVLGTIKRRAEPTST